MMQRLFIKGISHGLLTGLFDSSATFKKCAAEKLTFISLGLLDLTLTIQALNFGLSEINPFIGFLAQIPVLMVIVKFFIPVLIAWLVPGKLLWPSIILLALVVIWDIKELAAFLI